MTITSFDWSNASGANITSDIASINLLAGTSNYTIKIAIKPNQQASQYNGPAILYAIDDGLTPKGYTGVLSATSVANSSALFTDGVASTSIPSICHGTRAGKATVNLDGTAEYVAFTDTSSMRKTPYVLQITYDYTAKTFSSVVISGIQVVFPNGNISIQNLATTNAANYGIGNYPTAFVTNGYK
jgi:hypothetical protein